jgi:hypothetical protein
VEAIVALAWPLFAAAVSLILTFHYLITSLLFGSWVPLTNYSYAVYGVGTCLGLDAVRIVLRTQLGACASGRLLKRARRGLLCGAAAALAIPEGALPQLRFGDSFDVYREVFLALLPALCMAHFAFLGRAYLFTGHDQDH